MLSKVVSSKRSRRNADDRAVVLHGVSALNFAKFLALGLDQSSILLRRIADGLLKPATWLAARRRGARGEGALLGPQRQPEVTALSWRE